MGRKMDRWRSGLVDFVGVPLASDVFGKLMMSSTASVEAEFNLA